MKTTICCLLFFTILTSAAFAGDDWSHQDTLTNKPAPRRDHVIAYVGGDRVLLFGGDESDGNFNDETWIYDMSDNQWTQKTPTTTPSGCYFAAMAHIGDDKALLYGGYNINGYSSETWVYDLSDDSWTQITTTAPSERYMIDMAYIGDDQVLLFGGNGANDETWIFDLSDETWTQKEPTTKPSGRWHHRMAYIGEDRVLLFGGNVSGAENDETWVYDLSDNLWVQQSPATKPVVREKHAMAFIGSDQVLLFGGMSWPNLLNDSWVYDLSDNTWTQDTNTDQPSARHGHVLCETSMDTLSYIVLFGGDDAGRNDETWTFGGGDYLTGVRESFPPNSIPGDFQLLQNYPNPFNPITNIRYSLPEAGKVILTVYNLNGEQIARLVDGKQFAGNHSITWDASHVASGIYFYRLQAGDFVQTRKMLLLK